MPSDVKSDDDVGTAEFPIAEHVIEQSTLGSINRQVETRRDEIDLTAQCADSFRERVDTDETAASLPDIEWNGGYELKDIIPSRNDSFLIGFGDREAITHSFSRSGDVDRGTYPAAATSF